MPAVGSSTHRLAPPTAQGPPACGPLLPHPSFRHPGQACIPLNGWTPGWPVQSCSPPLLAATFLPDKLSVGRGVPGWGLLAPDLCPSRNRETSAHQAPSVRAQGASPCLPQPLVPGEEGGSTCHRPRGGAAGPSLPMWLSAFPDQCVPRASPSLRLGLALRPLCVSIPPHLAPQPPTQDMLPPSCLRGAGLCPLWVWQWPTPA